MGFTINTNTAATNAYRNLNMNQNAQAKSLEKLSSGLRINRAADDAAGLAISEGLKNQVSGMTVAARNAQDGISVIQTAEGALTEVHSILNRVRDLAVQAGNDSNNADSRAAISTEVKALGEELTRIGNSTNFNGIDLLNSKAPAAGGDAVPTKLTFQIGAGGVAGNDQIDVNLVDVAAIGKAVTDLAGTPAEGETAATGGFVSAAKALETIAALDEDIKTISTARSELGASQNRLESVTKSLNVSIENLSAAKSRITDTDMAVEMASFTRSQILSQAGTAMLAQANQMNSGVMQLLQ
ncbi:flagellin [Arthrobacter sp. zg-Y859]|uniref:Flagellin n=1 Tax=Arthrobacter jinronghuae TaxID=2964609 RepID=A0ABT1NU26_9MICC|nr:flagellin [Arthrobacter jinronghuae]MCQ1951193.1 flagellin [Arthrobacter jinronghuae]MCQ1957710.1 flagellin [Arthrobacter jinronghuae]UWX79032.1 flagellin [Arthrobacter jinronghuae]